MSCLPPCVTHQRLRDIMHGHLDMRQQLGAMGHGFLPLSKQLAISHEATYCTQCLPIILHWVSNFQVANKDEAT